MTQQRLVLSNAQTSPRVQQILVGNKVHMAFKVSDNERYGNGEWDKVPFSIELHADVATDGAPGSIANALNAAEDAIFIAARDAVLRARREIRDHLAESKFNGK